MAKKAAAVTAEALKDAEARGWDDWWTGSKDEPPKALKGELAEAWKTGFDKAHESRNVTAVLYKELDQRGYYLKVAALDSLSLDQRNQLGETLRDETFENLAFLEIDSEETPIDSDPERSAFHCRVVEPKSEEKGKPDAAWGAATSAQSAGFEDPSPLVPDNGVTNSGDIGEGDEEQEQNEDDVDNSPPEIVNTQVVPGSSPKAVTFDKPLEIPVDFGGVAFNSETVSVGLTIQRKFLGVESAAAIFVGNSVEGKVTLTPGDADSQQKTFPTMEDVNPHIPGPFISSGLSIKKKYYSVRLRLSVSDESDDLLTLTKFAKQRGTLVISKYEPHAKEGKLTSGRGDPDQRSEREHDPDIIHEDVEAGKNRPHGHPAMEALAEAQRETLPFPSPEEKHRPDDKLTLCDDQLLASLKSVAVPTIPSEILKEWSPEIRDEIDTWAKQVLQAKSGLQDIELPDVPDDLAPYLAEEQKRDPVGYALEHDGVEAVALQYYCHECQSNRDMEPDDDGFCRNEGCSSNIRCELVGFYGDPNVNAAGEYVDSIEFYVPTPSIPSSDGAGLTIRVATGEDTKYRPSCILHSDLDGVDYLFPMENEAPSIRHPGLPTAKQAVIHEVERISDQLKVIDGEHARNLYKDLQAYLLRVKFNGESPRDISDDAIGVNDGIAGKVGEE